MKETPNFKFLRLNRRKLDSKLSREKFGQTEKKSGSLAGRVVDRSMRFKCVDLWWRLERESPFRIRYTGLEHIRLPDVGLAASV